MERRPSDEANQCMGKISDEANQCMGMIMGEFGQDARVTPLLFYEGHPGIFNDHRE